MWLVKSISVLLILTPFSFASLPQAKEVELVEQQVELIEQKDNAKKIILAIDQNRLKEKKEFFENVFLKKGKFKKQLAIGSLLLAATAAGGYFGYKSLTKDQKTPVNSKSEKKASLDSLLRDRVSIRKIWREEGFKGVCNYAFWQGIGDGFYWGISAVLISAFVGLQSKVWNVTCDKFKQFWNGQDQEWYLFIQKNLEQNLKQLTFLLVQDLEELDVICYKDELKDNFVLFIDAIENFMAFTLVALNHLNVQETTIKQSLFGNMALLCRNSNDFLSKVQGVLDQSDGTNFFYQIDAESLTRDFTLLRNQVIRLFINSYSILYENKFAS